MVLVPTRFPGQPSYGACQLGDETVLDAVEVMRAATSQSAEPAAMLAVSRNARVEVSGRRRNLPARQRRARTFGDKSIGRDDAGVVDFQRIVEALSG